MKEYCNGPLTRHVWLHLCLYTILYENLTMDFCCHGHLISKHTPTYVGGTKPLLGLAQNSLSLLYSIKRKLILSCDRLVCRGSKCMLRTFGHVLGDHINVGRN